MRKIVVIIFSLLFALTALSQNQVAIELTSNRFFSYIPDDYFPDQRDRMLDSIKAYTWHDNSQQWRNNFTDQYFYDGHLHLVKWKRENWMERGDWINSFQVIYTYEGNLKTEEILQDWDTDIDDWINTTLNQFEYDEQGNKIEWIWKKWGTSSEAWINFIHYEYEYDASTNLIHTRSKMWDASNGIWFFSSNSIYTYNNDNLLAEKIFQSYNSNDSVWVNSNRTIYSYVSGSESYNESHFWDQANSSWIPDRRTELTYDDNDNLTEILNLKWDNLHVEWDNHSRSVNLFNQQGENSESLSQTWNNDSTDWQNKSMSNYEYNEQGERVTYIYKNWILPNHEWENHSKFRYVFRNIYSIEEQSAFDPGFCEMANPIISGQVFNCPKMVIGESYLIRLFDTRGRLVSSKMVKGGNDFTLERVQFNGLYFIVISDADSVLYFRKVIIHQ
jgi:hypothetical protein